MENLYLCPILYLDQYLEVIGLKRLAKKYAGRGITLKKTLSDTRYRRIFASPDFEAKLDSIIDAEDFTAEVNDACDLLIYADGKIFLVAD